MKSTLLALMLLLVAVTGKTATYAWTNTLGGDWSVTNNWFPHNVPANGDSVLITNNGTYTVTILSNSVTVGNLILGGASGTQTLLNGTANNITMTNFGTVRANGVLTLTNGGLAGFLTVTAGGQLNLDGAATKYLYNFALTNQGTVTWSGGYLEIGGNNTQTTYITNSGLWQITGNNTMGYGGGSTPTFGNSGTISKSVGTGTTTLSGMNLISSSSSSISAVSGALQLQPVLTNYISGSFLATSPGAITISGNIADAGGGGSGSGAFQFTSGNLYLRTNVIPGLQMLTGELYLGTNTFQQGGAITNLTIDGMNLHGPAQVVGTLTFNSGSLLNALTVQSSGQLVISNASGSKLIYGLDLINQGTVAWNAGALTGGGSPATVISNGGSWLINCNATINNGSGNVFYFTNSGTIHKIGGTGQTGFSGCSVINQTGGLIQSDSGTIYFYSPNYTNFTGTLRLNGGQIQPTGTSPFTLDGGTLDGSGSVGGNALIGGTISPGLNGGTGTMNFTSGLNLGSNATLVINGTGTTPGSQYDQLAVVGSVALGNCTLQVTSLPSVPLGTTFVIITNDYIDAVSGTFNGLPENSLITVSGQLFKIHYAGGSGNDVTLVRDNGATGTALIPGSFTNGAFHFTGNGFNSTVFTIQASTNFIQWTNIGTATSDVNGTLIFTDTNAPKFHYRFYRTTN